MQDNPEFASQAGCHDETPLIALQSLSSSAYKKRADHSRKMVQACRNIVAAGGLTKEERVWASSFENMHETLADAIENCPLFYLPINTIGAGCVTFSFSESIEWMRFDSKKDFETYLRRLQRFPVQVNEVIETMREGVSKGFVASTAQTRGLDDQLKDIINGDLPELNAPLTSQTILSADDPLLIDLKAAVESTKAAYATFLDFFVKEYKPALRTAPGVNSLPGGDELYARCLKYHTTTSLTAQEIHEIGLKEVAKIEGRYRNEVLIPLGFDPDDFPYFSEHAKTSSQFYVKNSDALLEVYRKQVAVINDKMPSFFNEIPRSPLEITSRSAGPAAYYFAGDDAGTRPGRFYVNVSHIEKRPTYESVSLSLHEAIPGHHHQVSLALENRSLPNFLRFIEDRRYEVCPCRRNLYSAYVEGWGLYSEHLGEEMDVYTTPYDVFGRLSMDMMRAVRCVVDTGIHALGWSIDKAMDYMMEKTGMHRHEVETEIYRYASWPGQAVAYKVGQIEILRLRKKAETELGDKFDVKAFHTVLLMSGPVPLSLLAEMIDDFIARNK